MSVPTLDSNPLAADQSPWDSIDAVDGAVEPAHPFIEESHAQSNVLGVTEREAASGVDSPEAAPISERGSAATRSALRTDGVELESPHDDYAPGRSTGGWTITLTCCGLGLIACCLIIPQVDANRRVAYQRLVLQDELADMEQQISTNSEFLKRVGDDPTLAQRLAERQMKVIPEGARVLDLGPDSPGMSPFQILSVTPIKPLPPYKPLSGTIANLCYGVHTRLYLIGIALGMLAIGLVMGN
jgi:hypothetical protein